jgi:hypothetical protein
MDDVQKNEDLIKFQKEMLDLMIKAGRRLMHDFDHMLDEIPSDNIFREEYKERAAMWRTIFYPDNGAKNYRSELLQTIMDLESKLDRANNALLKHGIDPRFLTPINE